MLKLTIYLTLALLCFISLTSTLDSKEDCDEGDFECLGDFATSSSKYSIITSSSSSFGQPLSTVNSANSTEILSDFHEAKLSTKHDPTKHEPKEGGIIQNDDSSPKSGSSDATGESYGLNNIQTGVLSACGVLVVGGIAVGIFVWKSTNDKKEQGMLDTDNFDNGHITLNQQFSVEKYQTYAQQQKQSVTEPDQSAKGNEQGNTVKAISSQENYQPEHTSDISIALPEFVQDKENFFSIGSNFLKESTIFSDHRQSKKTETAIDIDKSLLLTNFEDGLFSFDNFNSLCLENSVENTATIDMAPEEDEKPEIPNLRNNVLPSAENPEYDPTALTYSLRKLLQTPVIQQSPIQISLKLEIDAEEEE